jgi:putative ABC transport system permease protein
MRLLVTVSGVAFAVGLILVQFGLFVGLMRGSSIVIDHSKADIWVAYKNSENFDFASPLPEHFVDRVRSTPGAGKAATLRLGFSWVSSPDGKSEKVEVLGFHPDAGDGWGAPWDFVQGDAFSGVSGGQHVIVDVASARQLGALNVGDKLVLNRRQVAVGAVTEGIHSLPTVPFVFAGYDAATKLIPNMRPGMTNFILVNALPGVEPEELAKAIEQRVPQLQALTRDQFSALTRRYWSTQTGVGFAFALTAFLGFAVGLAIVGQTIYADTMEHLREYAILKAVGAARRDILSILAAEVAIIATLGYGVGATVSLGLQHLLENFGLTASVPPALWAASAGLTLGMCLVASSLSVRKVLQLEPASVFSGGAN